MCDPDLPLPLVHAQTAGTYSKDCVYAKLASGASCSAACTLSFASSKADLEAQQPEHSSTTVVVTLLHHGLVSVWAVSHAGFRSPSRRESCAVSCTSATKCRFSSAAEGAARHDSERYLLHF